MKIKIPISGFVTKGGGVHLADVLVNSKVPGKMFMKVGGFHKVTHVLEVEPHSVSHMWITGFLCLLLRPALIMHCMLAVVNNSFYMTMKFLRIYDRLSGNEGDNSKQLNYNIRLCCINRGRLVTY